MDKKIEASSGEPKIIKILNVEGDVVLENIEIHNDKVKVSGYLDMRTLYMGEEENRIYNKRDKVNFNEDILIDGINEDMKAEIIPNVENIDYRLLEDNNMEIKSVISLDGKITKSNTIDILKNVKGEKGLQVLKEKIKYNEVVGENSSTTIVKDAFELPENFPDIIDILRIDIKAFEKEVKVVEDKVIVAGEIKGNVMYLGDDEDNRVKNIKHEIPFTHFVDISGINKDMNHLVKLYSLEPSYEIKEDVNGRLRVIDLESLIKIDAKIFENKEMKITVDTYSTEKKIDLSKESVSINENIGSIVNKEIIKGVLDVSDDYEIIKDIYNIDVKPMITDTRIIDSKVVIEGISSINMLYLGEESGEIKTVKSDFPFKSYIDMDDITEDMNAQIDLMIEDIEYNKISSREVEVESKIKLNTSINRIKNINIVTEAVELEDEADVNQRPSIVIYTVKNNDTLWDIAKKFDTTMEELIDVNEIMTPDNIMPGEKIFIIKTVDVTI
nr:SPOCS domain-containing protein [Anaeromonas gelatinilytica]